SGGIDSSLLTALLQKNSTRPLKTFTVGFEDQLYDEAPHAKAIAQHLGTDHTTLYCTDQDLRQLLPQLAYFCDEPFGDTSLFPTHLVAALARQEVTVALSADGADELFGGYTRYEVAYRWFPKMKVWPLALRKHLATLLAWVPPHWLERNKNYFPVLRNYQQLPHKIHKLQQALRAENQLEFFKAATAYNHRATLQPFLPHFQPRFANQSTKALPNRLLGLLGLLDITTYLEGDILAKVDRASMQVALEARDPFLDHHLVEFALALPDEFKIRNGSTKYLLRQILYQYVPRELLERPKQGFSLPMRKWLRTHFQDELKQMSTDSAFAETFQLYPQAIQQLVCRFLKPKTFVDHHLVWFLFVLFQWQKRWL
ncbi:MAG: asparagine synthase C-terminal domain-containing protein, partial [Bacteroidota bacterium]